MCTFKTALLEIYARCENFTTEQEKLFYVNLLDVNLLLEFFLRSSNHQLDHLTHCMDALQVFRTVRDSPPQPCA